MSQSTKTEKLKFLNAARENTGRVGKESTEDLSVITSEMRDKASSEGRQVLQSYSISCFIYKRCTVDFRARETMLEKQ